MTATPNLDWFLSEVGRDMAGGEHPGSDRFYRRLEDILRKVPPGSEGVLYHPYLFPGGERGPFVKPTARASFTGLTLNHGRRHLLRAVYEGVALSMLDCYRHMPIEPKSIHLSGGGTNSGFWCQLIADCLGKQVRVPAGSQFGAKGAAINIGIAIGDLRQRQGCCKTNGQVGAALRTRPQKHRDLQRSIHRLQSNL